MTASDPQHARPAAPPPTRSAAAAGALAPRRAAAGRRCWCCIHGVTRHRGGRARRAAGAARRGPGRACCSSTGAGGVPGLPVDVRRSRPARRRWRSPARRPLVAAQQPGDQVGGGVAGAPRHAGRGGGLLQPYPAGDHRRPRVGVACRPARPGRRRARRPPPRRSPSAVRRARCAGSARVVRRSSAPDQRSTAERNRARRGRPARAATSASGADPLGMRASVARRRRGARPGWTATARRSGTRDAGHVVGCRRDPTGPIDEWRTPARHRRAARRPRRPATTAAQAEHGARTGVSGGPAWRRVPSVIATARRRLSPPRPAASPGRSTSSSIAWCEPPGEGVLLADVVAAEQVRRGRAGPVCPMAERRSRAGRAHAVHLRGAPATTRPRRTRRARPRPAAWAGSARPRGAARARRCPARPGWACCPAARSGRPAKIRVSPQRRARRRRRRWSAGWPARPGAARRTARRRSGRR